MLVLVLVLMLMPVLVPVLVASVPSRVSTLPCFRTLFEIRSIIFGASPEFRSALLPRPASQSCHYPRHPSTSTWGLILAALNCSPQPRRFAGHYPSFRGPALFPW